VHALDAAQVTILDVSVERPTLDDVFMTLTGHAAQDAVADTEADATKGKKKRRSADDTTGGQR
jgi:ABC-2 type transport system ATP-binding protein